MKIRPTTSADIPSLRTVLEKTSLFPDEMLADMVAPFLEGSSERTTWLTAELDGQAAGFCYAVQEELAEGTWNMLALAVTPDVQRTGMGRRLVQRLEKSLREKGQRIIIVDTSSSAAYQGAREFYRKLGYVEEARIRDFWGTDDDKVVFWKKLTASSTAP